MSNLASQPVSFYAAVFLLIQELIYRRLRPVAPRAKALLLTASALLGAGCATIQQYEMRHTEQLLEAAGFERHPADTPERQEELRSMPPHRIVSRTKNRNVVYTYTDPDDCRCVYLGGAKEYSEYERLRRRIAPRLSGGSPSGGAVGGAP